MAGKKAGLIVFIALSGISLIVGLFAFLYAFVFQGMYNDVDRSLYSEITSGTVTKAHKNKDYGDENYSAFISYNVDGEHYVLESKYSGIFLEVNDEVTVYYNPDEPQQAAIKAPKIIAPISRGLFTTAIASSCVFVFTFIMIFVMLSFIKKAKKRQQFLQQQQTYNPQQGPAYYNNQNMR